MANWSILARYSPQADLAGIVYRGPWDHTVAYVVNDAVSYAGGIWLAIANNTNVTPGTDLTKWIPFGGGSASSTAYVIDTIVANAITPDLSRGLNHEVTLNQATQITIHNPVWGSSGAVAAGIEFLIVVVQDGTGNRPSPAWGANFVGVSGREIGPDANDRTKFKFISTSAGKFDLVSQFLTSGS